MTINTDIFKSVVAEARRQNEIAENLNLRGGDFPVYDLREHFTARLGAATCLSGVDPETLRLPPLDAAAVAAVEARAPSSVALCEGVVLPVTYSRYSDAELSCDLPTARATCLRWPDRVCLPDGRALRVVVKDGYYAIAGGQDIAALRAELIAHAAKEAIEAWSGDTSAYQPPADGEVTGVVEIEGAVLCPITGAPISVGIWWEHSPYYGWQIHHGSVSQAREARDAAADAARLRAVMERSEALVERMRATGEDRYGGRFYDLVSKPYSRQSSDWVSWEERVTAALAEWDCAQAAKAAASERTAAAVPFAATHGERDRLISSYGAVEGRGAVAIDGRFYPGDLQVVGISQSSGGGVRYRGEITLIEGVDVVAVERTATKRNDMYVYGAGSPGWRVGWTHSRDGEVQSYSLATTEGMTTVYADSDARSSDGHWRSGCVTKMGWDGSESGPSPDDVRRAHGLPVARKEPEPQRAAAQVPSAPTQAATQAQISDAAAALAAKFGKKPRR